jgi:membrane-bound serine protease (ClpP class)
VRSATRVVAIALGALAFSQSSASDEAPRFVHQIVVEGSINPAVADYVASSIASATKQGAVALVVRLDTPGGLLTSMKTVVQSFLAAEVPVIVYVAPGGASATSAGVFVAMAGHVAAMAPGTTIGAAHPVAGDGRNMEDDMRAKVENFAVSFVESIAERRGRNVEWAEKAVRESVSITETEAASLRVVDFVAEDLAGVLDRAEGLEVDVAGVKRRLSFAGARGPDGKPRVIDVPMTVRQRVLHVIADPNIAYLLMMAGLLGLYLELTNPGSILPGVTGVICLLLALVASQVLPISSTGAILVVVGLTFLVAETFVPSFGVLGFGGLVALTLGSLFLYTPESELSVSTAIVMTTLGIFATAVGSVAWILMRNRGGHARTGSEGMIDERGIAQTRIHADGHVRVHGELWKARSNAPIDAGRAVTVRGVRDLELIVEEEAEKKEP